MTDVSFSERPKLYPKIYAYEDSNPKYSGLLKIGYTTIDVDKRLEQQGKRCTSRVCVRCEGFALRPSFRRKLASGRREGRGGRVCMIIIKKIGNLSLQYREIIAAKTIKSR